jgi:hypothetical protein
VWRSSIQERKREIPTPAFLHVTNMVPRTMSRHAQWYAHIAPAMVPVFLLGSAVYLVSVLFPSLFPPHAVSRASSSPSSTSPTKSTLRCPPHASTPSRAKLPACVSSVSQRPCLKSSEENGIILILYHHQLRGIHYLSRQSCLEKRSLVSVIRFNSAVGRHTDQLPVPGPPFG